MLTFHWGAEHVPMATLDGLRMAKKHMYFSSRKAEAALGFSAREISTLMEAYVEGEAGGWDKDRVGNLMHYRGRIDGAGPLDPLAHPARLAVGHQSRTFRPMADDQQPRRA